VSSFKFELKRGPGINLLDFLKEAGKISELVGEPIKYLFENEDISSISSVAFEFKVDASSDIADLSRKAVDIAKLIGDPVDFLFDGIEVNAYPSDDPEILEPQWRRDFDAVARGNAPHGNSEIR
jgi:hypothetical protein